MALRLALMAVSTTAVLACAGGPAGDSPRGSGKATVTWTPPTQRADGTPLAGLRGYHVRYGISPSRLTSTITVRNAGATSCEVTNLGPGTWYFAVSAFDAKGLESPNSQVVSKRFD